MESSILSETKYFEVFMTGEPIPLNPNVFREYIGTVHFQQADEIYHVYERTEIKSVSKSLEFPVYKETQVQFYESVH